MKKALMLASVASMIDQFNMPNISLLQELGYEVHVACNFLSGNTCSEEKITFLKEKLESMGVTYHQIDFARNVFDIKPNICAYRKVKGLISTYQYNLIHCHSPIGGVVGRLAARSSRKAGTRVIYTAHGFHFYKGAPLKNWLLYYPVEKFCAHFTDVLITINQEDYTLAQKKLKAKKVVYVPGVGIDLDKFGTSTIDKAKKRRELGIPEDACWLLNIGELIVRKNQETLIRAIANIPDAYLTIAGKGTLEKYLNDLICELGLSDRVKLLGFRTDINDLCHACDVFVFPSFHEGLPVAVMEAMATGLPVVCSNVRGNTDLVRDGKNGFLCQVTDADEFAKRIENLLSNEALRSEMGLKSKDIIQDFGLKKVMEKMYPIYGLTENKNTKEHNTYEGDKKEKNTYSHS